MARVDSLMRKVNFLFLASLLIAAVACGGSVYLLHRYQVRRNASAMLDVAREAETAGDLQKAASFLTQYLAIGHTDGPTYAWYAGVVDRLTPPSARGQHLLEIYEEALRHNLTDGVLERRCAEIAMQPRVRRYQDAIRHLEHLHDPIKDDPRRAAEAAELEDLLGQCQEATSLVDDAQESFKGSIAKDRTRIASYDRLARLLRQLKKDQVQADQTIDEMVQQNPGSALALVTRYRYRKDVGLPADEADIARALRLGPDEAEVLIAAAELARRKNDLAGARKHIERGLERYPDRAAFYQLAARLDLAESHLDRAEAVLRRGIGAVADNADLKYLLTDTLIDEAINGDESKLKGDDGATAWIERLRIIGLPEGYIHLFEGRAAIASRSWNDAIPLLESARSLLSGDATSLSRVNLLLAECYDREGKDEDRMAALERAATAGVGAAPAARLLYAQELEQQGKLDQAIAVHLELASSRPESRLDLVRLLIQKNSRLPEEQRNWEPAERRLQEAASANPQAAEELTLLRADLLAARNRLEEARTKLAAAQAKEPRSLRLRLALARIAQRGKKHSEALQILDQAEKELGFGLGIQLARLDVAMDQGGDEARAVVATLAETSQQLKSDDRPRFLDRLAQAALRLRERDLARRLWDDLLTIQPANLNALLSRFDLSIQSKDLAGAREFAEKVRQAEGRRDGGYGDFTEAALDLEEYRRGPATSSSKLTAATSLAAKICELRPGWWAGPVLKGEIAELKNLTDEAIADFKNAIAMGALQPSLAARLLAMVYRNEGEQARQIPEVTRLLREKGFPVESLAIADAVDAISKGEPSHGLALARQALPESSPSFSDHLILARIYRAGGQMAEAEKQLERSVELGPGVPDTWLLYVNHLAATGQIDRAREVIRAAARSLPPDQSVITLANCWAMVGDARQAEALIHQALSSHPSDPATLRNAILLYLRLRRMDEAEKALVAFEKLGELTGDQRVWVSRIRQGLLLGTGRLADQDESLRLVDQNLQRNPGNRVDLRMKVSTLAARPGRRLEAIKILEQLIDPADPLVLRDRLYLAELYLAEKMEDKYQDQMSWLVGPGKPNFPDALAIHIRFLIDRSRLDEAASDLVLLKKADPRGLTSLGFEAELLSLHKKRAELLTLLSTYGQQMPSQIGQVGDLLARYGFLGEAEQAYKDYVARQPDQHDRVLALAHFYATIGRTAEAMRILEQAWKGLPQEQVAQAALAVYDSESASPSEKQQVRVWVEKVVKDRPDSWLKSRLAGMSLGEGNTQAAIAVLREILARNPDDAGALNNLAWILGLLDPSQTEEALSMIEHAIKLQGSNSTLLDTRAVILIRAGRYDAAIRDLKAAEELLPTERPALRQSLEVHLAWAYQGLGLVNEARAAFLQAEGRGFRLKSTQRMEQPFLIRLRRDLNLGAEATLPRRSAADGGWMNDRFFHSRILDRSRSRTGRGGNGSTNNVDSATSATTSVRRGPTALAVLSCPSVIAGDWSAADRLGLRSQSLAAIRPASRLWLACEQNTRGALWFST
jgi:predicted Zn-dependent protease